MRWRILRTVALAATVSAVDAMVELKPANAATEALLIARAGTPEAGRLTDMLAHFRASLSLDDVQVATPQNPHDIADKVRAFLSMPGRSENLRLVWIVGLGSGS